MSQIKLNVETKTQKYPIYIGKKISANISQNTKSNTIKFKKCLVCPERWNRKSDIVTYKKILKSMNFKIDAVMTSKSNINYWLKN